MRTFTIQAICATIVYAAPVSAISGEASPEIKAMFENADTFYRNGDYERAAFTYREILKIEPLWRMYLNIGQCEMKRGRYDLAMEAFQTYFQEGGDKITAERRDYANKRMKEMTPKVSSLTFPETDTFDILVDDEKRATTPTSEPLYVLSGEHRVTFEKDGGKIFERTVSVQAEEVVSIERPKPEPAPKQAPETKPRPVSTAVTEKMKQSETAAPVQPRRSPLKPIGITLLVIGTAALIPGIITGAMSISDKNDLEESCPEKRNCSDAAEVLQKSAETKAVASNILLPIGGVLAVTGIVLTVVGIKKSKKDKAVAFLPLVENHSAGLMIEGRF